MKTSTTSADRRIRLWAVAFWLLIWQLASMAVDQRLLLASPVETLRCLAALACQADFWQSALHTTGRILTGYLAALAAGVVLAGLSAAFVRVRELLAPLLAVIKSVPVASFVIVALIWIPSRNLSVLISFLIALPILYAGALNGIACTDAQLLEMARVFRMRPLLRLRCLYLPAAMPALRSAMGVAAGLAWKSGVAAEVIGIPDGSIGERLYRAKIYLATPELFAWTLTIVLLSLLCEKLLLRLTDAAMRRLNGG